MAKFYCYACERQRDGTPDAPAGYVSSKQSTLGFAQLEGRAAIEVIQRAVCRDCYRKEWSKAYPGQPCPV